jgi:hypothetical protein
VREYDDSRTVHGVELSSDVGAKSNRKKTRPAAQARPESAEYVWSGQRTGGHAHWQLGMQDFFVDRSRCAETPATTASR